MHLRRHTLTMAWVLTLAAPIAFCVTVAPSAHAAAKKKAAAKKAPKPADKVVVVLTEGPDSEELGVAVEGALPKGLVVSNKPELQAELVKQGQKGPFGKALDSSKTREAAVEKIKKAAEAAAVDVVIVIQVQKTVKARKVTVLIIDPKLSTLAREDEVTLAAKKPKDPGEDTGPILESVKPTLDVLKPKAGDPPAPKDDEEEAPAEAPPPPSDDKGSRPGVSPEKALVHLHAGVDFGMRKFEYAGAIETGRNCPPEGCTKLRPYSVNGAPLVSVAADLFPFASQDGILGGLGVYGAYGRAIGLESAAQGGNSITTVWDRMDFGLQLRLKLGDAAAGTPPLLYAIVGWGSETFSFQGAGLMASEVPNVGYKFVRIGINGRLPVSDRIAIRAGVSLLPSLSAGGTNTVAARFNANPSGGKTSVFGFDMNVAIAVRITGGLEADLGTRYTRQSYTFETKKDDPFQAAGASEQMAGLVRVGLTQSF